MNHLEEVVRDLERHAAEAGWDAPPRLYALADSADLRRLEPELAGQLPAEPGALVPVEQELPADSSVEDLMHGIVWPSTVLGCVLVMESVVVPSDVEDEIPEEPASAKAFVAGHPRHEDVRMVVGVLRDGSRQAALRVRRYAGDDELLVGPDLVPAVADLLDGTLEPDEPEQR